MDEAALDDAVAACLAAWYTQVALWQPPGRPTTRPCIRCAASFVRGVFDPGDWPHDVVHGLVTSMNRLDKAVTRPRLVAALKSHRADMLDVLQRCVEPRLLEWPGLVARRAG